MNNICEWCYYHELKKKSSWLFYNKSNSDRKIDKEALDWLGIKEDEICQSCCNQIQRITERVTQNFKRPLDVMLNLHKFIPYEKLSKEIKIIGWLYFLQDNLREHTRGRYFKKRFNRLNKSSTNLE